LTGQEDPKAHRRMQVILDYLAGRLNVTQAAQMLNVSRKTFYEWLERAREGMFQALRDRESGRPPGPAADVEKEKLLETLEQADKDRQVLENRLRIQEAFRQTIEEMHNGLPQRKKKRLEP
jgi:transposase